MDSDLFQAAQHAAYPVSAAVSVNLFTAAERHRVANFLHTAGGYMLRVQTQAVQRALMVDAVLLHILCAWMGRLRKA